MGDPTKIVLVATSAHCRVFFDGELVSHLTGFNTKEGWIDQVHLDSEGSAQQTWPVVRRHGKVEAVFDPGEQDG